VQLRNQSLDASLQGGRVRTDNIGDLLAVLEEHEGGHGTDTELGGNVGELIDVDLVELGLGVGLGELLNLGGDGLAGTAPRSKAVEDDGLLGVEDLLLELSLAVWMLACPPCLMDRSEEG
jgi:hypothetical protein